MIHLQIIKKMGINCEICDKDCENYVLFSELYNMCLCTVLYERLTLDSETTRYMYYYITGAYCREYYEETKNVKSLGIIRLLCV